MESIGFHSFSLEPFQQKKLYKISFRLLILDYNIVYGVLCVCVFFFHHWTIH